MNRSLIFRSLLTAFLVCVGAHPALAQQEPDQQAPDEQPAVEQPAQPDTADEEEAVEEDDQEEPAADEEPTDEQEPADEQPADQEQQPADEQPADEQPADEQPADEQPADEEADEEPTDEEDVEELEAPRETTPEVEEEPIEAPPAEPDEGAESPISDLADESQDEDFVPLEELEEGVLDSITPAEVYPYVDWSGYFRLRNQYNVGFDLGTTGTSAVPAPAEAFIPASDQTTDPVDSEADSLWSSDIRLRLEPTINITESLRLHIEADLFDNLVLGTRYDDPSFTGVINSPDRGAPMIRINEGWGEIETFFGTLRAGRMDDDWGLGIFADNGDCPDCDVENPIDRISFTTHVWELYARLSVDFPSEGATTDPLTFSGRPYDVSQTDDADQFTLAVFHTPTTREEREVRAHRLRSEKRPVFDGGLYFTYRNQTGFFSEPGAAADQGEIGAIDQGDLVYRGMELYIPDLWFEMLYNPDSDTLVRVALEAVGIFGNIDNATTEPVGTTEAGDDSVNCFNESARESNQQACTTQGLGADRESVSRDVTEFGVALESELYFGGPLRFGLNGGLATGGPQANWGFEGDADGNVFSPDTAGLDFYRFHPNYHVDQILFRQVIGTVTNAYYGNPWAQLRFFETPDSRMELQLDTIFSAAFDPDGTPSAVIDDGQAIDGNRWLGLEIDAALRYLEFDRFTAEVEGGVLFPFSGLDAQLDGRRLIQAGRDTSPTYGQDIDAEIAWTVQGNLYWSF